MSSGWSPESWAESSEAEDLPHMLGAHGVADPVCVHRCGFC